MKILFLSDNFPPEVNAPATRTYEHCKVWVEQGADVTVITCAPNFPSGKLFEGYKNKLFQREERDGVRVIRVWSYISPNSGLVKRTLDFISFAVLAFCVGLFQKFDVVIGTSPQFFTAVSARCLSFFSRKPWIMEVRDLWPESIAAVGLMKSDSIIFRLLKKVERHLYRSANAVIVLTDSFKSNILKLGIDQEKVCVIKNGVNPVMFTPGPKNIELLNKLSLIDKFIVGYIGTHGMAHALNFILDCAAKVKNRHIHFIFQGDGANKKDLEIQAKKLDLKNITFLPFVSKEEIVDYISILDVALVNLKKSDTFRSVIPSKIFESASMMKPILLGVEGEAKILIENYDAGLCFEPENESSFLEQLDIIVDPNIYLRLQEGCRDLALNFDRNTLAIDMLEKIKAIAI